MKKISIGQGVGFIFVCLLFLISVALSRSFTDEILSFLDIGYAGMIVYVLAGIVATVAAPVSSIPLIPFASVLYGPFITAVLSIVAWTIGAAIAFIVARRFGQPFIARFINMKDIMRYENIFGEKYIFFDILLLRMAVPVDILSYTLGLFTTVPFHIYITASLFGVAPFAFVMAYTSTASPLFQVITLVVIIIALVIGFMRVKKIKNS